jgi:hypothetical protein
MDSDDVVREHLLQLLRGENAHMSLAQATANFPEQNFNSITTKISYSPWQLLEHIRIAQWDILEFIRDPDHVSPQWPAGYWPAKDKKVEASEWFQTIDSLQSDMSALEQIVQEPRTDLYADLLHAEGYTILREILLVADHNAYHLGEFGILKELVGE